MSFLEILAECAIALAGFGAVHAVLQGSSGPRGIFRSWTVVLHGATAFILAVIPLLLDLSSLSSDQLWRTASVVGAACAGFNAYLNFSFDARLTKIGHLPQAKVILRIAQVSTVLAMLAMISNALGWPSPPGPLLYAVGPVFILITGLLAMLHSFLVPLQMFLDSESSDSNES